MEKQLRKNQNTLIVTGMAVVALSLWNVIKTFLFIRLDPENYKELVKTLTGGSVSQSFTTIFVFSMLGIDFLLRLYVALKANKEGRGKGNYYFYLIIAGFFVLTSVISIIYYFEPEYYSVSVSDTFLSVLFDVTSVITVIELIYSSITVKVLSHKIKAGGDK